MCLETIINHYAFSRISKSYFDNYLDKLELKSKWIISPKLFSNAEFNRDSKAFELLKKVIKLRNKLVHYKPRIIEYSFELSDKIKREEDEIIADVKDSIQAMIYVIKELNRIDSSWSEYKFYSFILDENPEILECIK